MLRYYSLVGIGLIYKLKKVDEKNWKIGFILYQSAFFSIYLISIAIIIEKIFQLSFSSAKNLMMIKLEAVLIYFIPSIIFNFFFFLYHSRYNKLIEKYGNINNKLHNKFLIFGLLFFILSIMIMIIGK